MKILNTFVDMACHGKQRLDFRFSRLVDSWTEWHPPVLPFAIIAAYKQTS